MASANCRGDDRNRQLAGMQLHPDGVYGRAREIPHTITRLPPRVESRLLTPGAMHAVVFLVLGIIQFNTFVLRSSFVGMLCAGKGDGDGARERGPQRPQAMDVFGGTEGQVKASPCRRARKRGDESSALYRVASPFRRLPR
jgi:hypothetical protein